MRALFVSYAERTHFYNMVPLAWALRNAGHDVHVVSQPMLEADVLSAGLPFSAVGEDHAWQEVVDQKVDEGEFEKWNDWINGLMTDPTSADLEELETLYRAGNDESAAVFNKTLVEGIVEIIDRWAPDLIVWEMLTYAGSVAARVRGVPHLRLLWGADVHTRLRHRFLGLMEDAEPSSRTDPLGEWLDTLLAPYGESFDEEILTGQATLEQSPPSLRLDLGLPTLSFRHVPYNGPAVVSDWLYDRPEKPRVCVTAGLSLPGFGLDPLPLDKLGELGSLDIEAIATFAPDAPGADDVPDNVRLAGFVPLHALLPSCDAVVHIGGVGAVSSAIASGVPQLFVAGQWDSVVRGRMFEDLGAGRYVMSHDATARDIADAVRDLVFDPTYRRGAEKLRDEIRQEPSPNAVVDEIEEFVDLHERDRARER